MQTLLIITSWIVVAITGGMAIIFYRRLKLIEYEFAQLRRNFSDKQDELSQVKEASIQDESSRSKFFACASHDLRQPLHALSLFCNVLNNKPLTPDVKELADNIHQSTLALVGLFNTLFDVSKLETGSTTVKIRDIPLQSIFKILDAEYKPQAEQKSLQWSCNTDNFYVCSDLPLLETILRNLISNALRYTKKGGITLASYQRENRIFITVSDTGVGIAPSVQQDIFQEFKQLKNSSAGGTTGLGLGLSIVERLIKILGHEIEVSSELGLGTMFTLIVKEGSSDVYNTENNHIDNSKPKNELEGIHLLVVDDDPQVRSGMQSILESWDCKVSVASTSTEVHRLIIDDMQTPDAIISDYRLSKSMTGIQLLDDLIEKSSINVPVLIISGESSSELTAAIEEKRYLYLQKPVAPAKLRAFVRSVAKKIRR